MRDGGSSHWVDLFRAANVPCVEVRTLEAAFADEQVDKNHLTQKMEQPGIGEVEVIGSLMTIDGAPLSATTRPAPSLGEHNREILTALSMPRA